MDITSKITEMTDSLMESLNQQEWFQELRGHWDNLDQQSKSYIKLGSVVCVFLFVSFLVLSSMWRVNQVRNDLSEKQEILSFIQSANSELNQLKDRSAGNRKSPGSEKETGGWPSYFETIATSSGIDKSALNISDKSSESESKKSAKDSKTTIKEALFDISVKKINLKQAVQFSFNLENGQRIVKLRNLSIDTKGDPSGYLEATFSVSGLSILPQN